MKPFLCGLVALGLLVGGAGEAKGQPSYVYTTIDVPSSSPFTQAFGVNDLGQVGGNSNNQGFLLSGGNLSTVQISPSLGTFPRGINDSGDIVGYYTFIASTRPPTLGDGGFVLSGGNVTKFFVPGSTSTAAFGINNLGQIVGAYESHGPHGFLFSGGSYTTVDFPGFGLPHGINNAGEIVGNNNGESFLLSGGVLTPLSVPGSTSTEAYGINDAEQILGTYYDANNVRHGFLLSGGSYSTLDPPGSIRTFAFGINDAGAIVGEYGDAAGNVHGFLATPIPEPSTLLLLAIGTCGLIGWAWQRR
jgi:probable HAF family extracellular repeat protein